MAALEGLSMDKTDTCLPNSICHYALADTIQCVCCVGFVCGECEVCVECSVHSIEWAYLHLITQQTADHCSFASELHPHATLTPSPPPPLAPHSALHHVFGDDASRKSRSLLEEDVEALVPVAGNDVQS
jgi:hypothetical protein